MSKPSYSTFSTVVAAKSCARNVVLGGAALICALAIVGALINAGPTIGRAIADVWDWLLWTVSLGGHFWAAAAVGAVALGGSAWATCLTAKLPKDAPCGTGIKLLALNGFCWCMLLVANCAVRTTYTDTSQLTAYEKIALVGLGLPMGLLLLGAAWLTLMAIDGPIDDQLRGY